MKPNKISLFCLAVFLIGIFAPTGNAAELPLEVKKLSDRAIVVSIKGGMNNNVIALQTEKGLVVIDTQISPAFASLIRKRIAKEFGRRDFTYTILTHGHMDHSFGTQVFADTKIIGHKNCEDIMARSAPGIKRLLTQYRQGAQQMQQKLKDMEEGSNQARITAAQIDYYTAMCDGLEQDFVLTPPHLKFSDAMTLYLGDITLELLYYGQAHSGSDILIFCPEEGLLLTGDLFSAGTDPYLDSERIADLDRWEKNLNHVLNGDHQLKTIVPGHEGLIPVADLQSKLAFVRAKQKEYAGKQSGLEIFTHTYQEAGVDSAIKKMKELRAQPDKYFFLHGEFDTFAFRMLRNKEKVGEALKIFLVLSEFFPEEPNAFDSLGEAYLLLDDKTNAIKNYEKSLKLNSKNNNAIQRLKQLKEKK